MVFGHPHSVALDFFPAARVRIRIDQSSVARAPIQVHHAPFGAVRTHRADHRCRARTGYVVVRTSIA